ncbi:MAG: hypothetical protein AAF652_03855 [Cyanobacteria bacterium P01_C01_bin.72]
MKRSLTTVKLLSGKVLGISLGALGILNLLCVAASADVVGNQGIRFSEDTIVEFEFIESHGAYQSTFGVIDLDSCQTSTAGVIDFDSCARTPLLSEVKASDKFDTVYRRSTYETDLQEARNNDFLGSPGDTVPDFEQEFIFEGNKPYAFYLESEFDGKPAGTVYTTDLINARGNRQALFNEEGLTATAVAKRRNNPAFDVNKFDYLVNGGLLINFDDTGSTLVKTEDEDVDFDDFIVGMGGGALCNYDDLDDDITDEIDLEHSVSQPAK